ncbi:MAG: choice-of-anchor Q domain-containing protein [Caldilineaceae bacterium]
MAATTNKMVDYMKSLCAQRPQPQSLPHDFVSDAAYMAVDDAGYTFLADNFYRHCDQNDQPQYRSRLSLWDPEGRFVGSLETFDSSTPVTDIKFDLDRGYIYMVANNGASNFSFITIYQINRDNRAAPFAVVDSFDMMNEIEKTPEGRLVKFFDANEAIADSNGALYVMSREPAQGLALFQQTGDDRYPLKLVTHLVYNQTSDVDESGLNLRFLSSMALDSQDNLYVFTSHPTFGASGPLWPRIYKFAAATVDSNGNVQPGELIGWLGKCDSGPNCDYINGRSIGYSCTDETCFIDAGGSGSGSRAGQFNTNSSTYKHVAIAIDPNDVLYVADYENRRVQRFSPAGAVAGEANSVGDGSSFVLGDFGTPDNIAVNKSSFYILDDFNEIVHVFDAAVIHGIDEQSAWVEYQSDANYVGPDSFTFAATDGFRTVNEFSGETDLLKSAPATVAINVSRNHRPPQAAVGLSFTTAEDMPVAVTLQGNDLDNFGVQRDQLTFQVVRQPLGGTLSGSGANLTYTPDADFTGEDSFVFTVSDDRFTSEPETVALLVTPVNDAPTVIPESTTLRGGAGYPLTLRADVVDAEADDTHTMQVDWGDGTVESDGQIGGDSLPTGPILIANDTFTSTLTAFHTYAAGSYTIKATATDVAGAKGAATVAVTIDPMADLALTRQGSNVVSINQPTLSYELLVTHNRPSSGGISAANVTLRETLGSGLRYRLAAPDSGTCTPNGQTLTCNLGALAAGATNRIRIVVDAAADLAVGKEVPAFATVSAATADPIAENNSFDGKITMLYAADFLVNDFREGTDVSPGDGLCATAQGVCTVRAAVQEANALPGKQTVALARGVYLLNVFPAGDRPAVEPSPENHGVTGDLDITGDLEILGLSADQSTLHANNGDRVIEILNGAKVLISDVMLTGGLPLQFDASGGALRNIGGEVTLRRITATGNVAPNGGGAIHNQSGTMRVEASAFVGNNAGDFTSTPVQSSEAVGQAGSGAAGGAIWNEGTLTLANVTISGNQAEQGGGLAVTGGTVVVTNGTIYANSAATDGGGIWTNSDSVRIGNTILAGNSAGVTGPDCTAQVRSDGHNLLSNLTDCTVLGATATNIIDANVGLSALAAADGETYGHPLLETSRAVDAGSCALATDQRGVERPQGQGCDIGALELGGILVSSTLYLPVVAR